MRKLSWGYTQESQRKREADVGKWNLSVPTGKENNKIIVKIAASEMTEAQTFCSNTKGVVGWKRSYLEE